MRLRLFAVLGLLPIPSASSAVETPYYQVELEIPAETLKVQLCLPQSHPYIRFAADSEWAKRYLTELKRHSDRELVETKGAWNATSWQAGECLSYRVKLGEIADAHKPDVGWRIGSDLVSSPQLWLLRPDIDAELDIELKLPPDWHISAPWQALPNTDGHRFRIGNTPANWSAVVALGHFEEQRIPLADSVLHVAILQSTDEKQRKLMLWLRRVSQAALSAYGKLPMADVQVLILPVGEQDKAVVFGQSVRGQGHGLQLLVNANRPDSEFASDWVAVHELSHLFHPYLGDRGRWLAEGLASYYQNVLRARAGLITPLRAWENLDAGFQRGKQQTFDETLNDVTQGMEHTHMFMRVYWAGAAYWLTVDEELRRTSHGQLSVDEALRRFRDCCLPSRREWSPQEFVTKLDALIGSGVFTDHYREFGGAKQFPDMRNLYKNLGIEPHGASLRLLRTPRPKTTRDTIMAPR